MVTISAEVERLASACESAADAASLEKHAHLEAAKVCFRLTPAPDALRNSSAQAAAALQEAQDACAQAQAFCRGKFDIHLLVAESETLALGNRPRSTPATLFSPSMTFVSQVETEGGLGNRLGPEARFPYIVSFNYCTCYYEQVCH
jgi:hypothetical protein